MTNGNVRLTFSLYRISGKVLNPERCIELVSNLIETLSENIGIYFPFKIFRRACRHIRIFPTPFRDVKHAREVWLSFTQLTDNQIPRADTSAGAVTRSRARSRQSFLRRRHRAGIFDCIGQTVMQCGPVGGAGYSMRFNKFHYRIPSFRCCPFCLPPASLAPLSSADVLHRRAVRSAVLQIKPACTSLIEQNFNTGSTRNSAPWVTKHRVNTMVHSALVVQARLVGGKREEEGEEGGQRVVCLDLC